MNRAGFSVTGEPRLLSRPLWTSPSDRQAVVQDEAFQPSNLIAAEQILALAFGAGRYVCVGYYGRVHYTDNRVTWTTLNYPVPINGQWVGIAYSPTLTLFACCGNVNGIYTSPTGVTWTFRDDTSPDGGMEKMEWCGDRFVAAGFGFKAYYSTNGTTWTASGTLPVGFPDGALLTGRTRWVMIVGTSSRLLMSNQMPYDKLATSTDGGATWGTVTMPYYQLWNALGYNGAVYVASGGGEAHQGFAVSYNGTTWTTYPSFSRGQTLSDKIIWTGRVFVALSTCNSKYYWTSPNGVDWVERQQVVGYSATEWIPCAGGTEDDVLMTSYYPSSGFDRPRASRLSAKEVVYA